MGLAALFVLGACGDLAPSVEDLRIQCDRNDQCPTDYYCAEVGRCQPREEGSPPRLELVGVRPDDGGAYGDSLALPRGETSGFEYKLKNVGGAAAAELGARFSSEDCPAFEFTAQIISARSLPTGVSVDDRESVEPSAECASPSTVTIVMRTATQTSRATFEFRPRN